MHTIIYVVALIGIPASLVMQLGLWASPDPSETRLERLLRRWSGIDLALVFLALWLVSDYVRSLG